jgi:histidinol-phosphate aminotransferase
MNYFRPQIAAMSGYVPGEQPRTGKFIKLNTNENPYPASARAQRAIEATLKTGLGKYPDPMATAFRMRAAELFGVEPDWILCGNGSDDLLTIVMRTFAGEGDCVRYPYPSYVLYRTLAQIQGATTEEIRFSDDWQLPHEFTQPTNNPRIAFLANPNSPSGTCLTPEQVRGIAGDLPCPLLVDEAYVDFAETNCVELVRENEKILVARSLSKSYALAGLRFGFVIAQPTMIEQLTKVKDSYNCDALAIAGATAAIDDQAWLSENRAKIIASRTRFAGELQELGFAVQPSQANFVWCSYSGRPLQPVCEQLKENGVLVRYLAYPGWSEGIRISIGTDEQLDACLVALRGILSKENVHESHRDC